MPSFITSNWADEPDELAAGAVDGALTPDVDEIGRFIRAAFDPERTYEIRSLPSGRSRLVSLENVPGAVAAVAELAAAPHTGIYYTLNPVDPELGDRAAKDADIVARRLILIDVDPEKGEPKASATEGEKGAAFELGGKVHDFLADYGWPEPFIVDSGNGVQLLYACDLPNNEASKTLVQSLLKALASKFNTGGAKVDTAVSNASRVARMAGTWNRKGDATGDRPYRIARLLSMPETVEAVAAPLIEAAALQSGFAAGKGEPPGPNDPLPPHCWKVVATPIGDRQAEYALAALEQECEIVSQTVKPGRGDAINRAAFNLGQLVAVGAIDEDTVIKRVTHSGLATGLSRKEVNHNVRRGFEAGMNKPRILPPLELDASEAAASRIEPGKPFPKGMSVLAAIMRAEAEANPESDPDDPTLGAEAVKPEDVKWLWPGRIPLGKLTTIAGPGGLGKSFVTCKLASIISNGDEWPFADGECAERGGVLIINSEDAPGDTLVPRLIKMGADRSKIRFMKASRLGGFQLKDLNLLHDAVCRTPDCRMVVIDPAPNHLGKVDDNGNSPLRGLLTPLSLYMAWAGLACVLVTHTGKPKGQQIGAAGRVLGSVAWVNAVRSLLMFARDKDRPGECLILTVKNNLAPPQPAIGYRLAVDGKHATVEWTGVRDDVDADEAVEAGPGKGGAAVEKKKPGPEASERRGEVARWLYDYLISEKIPVPAQVVYEAVDKAFPGALGERLDNGRWKNLTPIYRAADDLEKLPPPRDGCTVAKDKNPTNLRSYWRLVESTPAF